MTSTPAEQPLHPLPEQGVPPAPGASTASVWPFTLAGGMTLLIFGFTSSIAFSVAGLAIVLVAIGGWISELRPS
jgi:hypothetical protein